MGLAIAEAALSAGDSVAATARNPSQLSSLVVKYGAGRVLALALDITNNDQVGQSVQSTIQHFGRIDVVVNNAGYANIDSFEDMSLEDFRAQFETNFFGAINVTKAVIPQMRKQNSGHILQISSVGGRVGSPGLSSYQSAKWALGGFSTVLQQEVKPFGIRVTVCEPGGMKTDWAGASMGVAGISEGYKETIGVGIESRRGLIASWSEPAQVAKAIVYITNVSDPPLRLLLGPETPGHAKHAANALAEFDEKWLDVTMLRV